MTPQLSGLLAADLGPQRIPTKEPDMSDLNVWDDAT